MSENWKLAALGLVMVMLAATFIVGYPTVWAVAILAVACVCVAVDNRLTARKQEQQ